MLRKTHLALLAMFTITAVALAQGPGEPVQQKRSAWRTVGTGQDSRYSSPRVAQAAGGAADNVARTVRRPAGNLLTNEAGQVWQEYDISPYTLRITETKRPEQAVVDWILRETGYEAWHSEPMGVLCANRRSLKVYHTPAMQQIVADVVDRFVDAHAETHTFSLRVVTITDPNWRTRAHGVMTAVPVQSQGAQAWIVRREEAAMLFAELSKRSDFREHGPPNLRVHNGHSYVLSRTRTKNYMQDILLRPESWPGFEAMTGAIEEGLSLEFSPLLSRDEKTVDAVVKCYIDQVEQTIPVLIDTPNKLAPQQQTQIEAPQMSQFRLQERFRWPVEYVLVVNMGIVPTPHPPEPSTLPFRLSLSNPPPPRADLLVFIESKDIHTTAPGEPRTAPCR